VGQLGLGLGLGLTLGLQLGIGIGFRRNHSWSSTFTPRRNHSLCHLLNLIVYILVEVSQGIVGSFLSFIFIFKLWRRMLWKQTQKGCRRWSVMAALWTFGLFRLLRAGDEDIVKASTAEESRLLQYVETFHHHAPRTFLSLVVLSFPCDVTRRYCTALKTVRTLHTVNWGGCRTRRNSVIWSAVY